MKWILVNVPEMSSRGIFTNIYKPEASNCFSIITQVIIEILHIWNILCCKVVFSDSDREPLSLTTDYFSCDNSRLLSSWLTQKTSTNIYSSSWPPLFSKSVVNSMLLKPFCYINKVLNGFFVTFNTFFTTNLWRVSLQTLLVLWYSSE